MKKDYKRWTERAKDGSPALITERIFYELGKLQGQIKKRYFTDSDVLDIVTRYLSELEDKIENGTLIELPKYKLNQKVYVLPLNNSIGTIDGYDLFKHKYLVYIECGDEFGKLGFGNEWFTEQELSATKPKPKQSCNISKAVERTERRKRMSKIEIITCDKCGKELTAINNAQISQTTARIDLYPIGQPRTYPSQRIDLCEDCFNEFVNFMETIQ